MTICKAHKTLSSAALVLAAVTVAVPASAQGRGGAVVGRAVPRGPVARVVRPTVVSVVPFRPYAYRPYFYRPAVSLGFYYGYPYYGPYPYVYPYAGYGYYPAAGYGYGYAVAARPYGGVRIDVAQENAEVYADGYYVGRVDEFNGRFQELTLPPGPHRIEVRAPGLESIAFDVNVEPGRTITYRAAMQPARP
jgi:PEGA domain-containing protein